MKWWFSFLVGFLIGAVAVVGVVSVFTLRPQTVAVDYVALVNVDGPIAYTESPLAILAGDFLTPRDVENLVSQVRRDPYAKAVVVVINSPGGSAVASEEIYRIFKKLSEEKVVVSYISEYGASGGYYIALPAREIISSRAALTGSVGAVSVLINWHELMDRLGVRAETFKSGKFKDIGSEWRPMTDEERKIMQNMIDDIAKLFADRVREHRAAKINDWDDVLSARPFTGVEALRVGLVDGVGSLHDAVGRARQLANLPDTAPTRWIRPPSPSLLDLLLGGGARRTMNINYEVLTMWPLPNTGLHVAASIRNFQINDQLITR